MSRNATREELQFVLDSPDYTDEQKINAKIKLEEIREPETKFQKNCRLYGIEHAKSIEAGYEKQPKIRLKFKGGYTFSGKKGRK